MFMHCHRLNGRRQMRQRGLVACAEQSRPEQGSRSRRGEVQTCCTVCLCPRCVRFATVLPTKLIISLTAPRWKKPKLLRSHAWPRMKGSLSPFDLSRRMAVSFIYAEQARHTALCCKSGACGEHAMSSLALELRPIEPEKQK